MIHPKSFEEYLNENDVKIIGTSNVVSSPPLNMSNHKKKAKKVKVRNRKINHKHQKILSLNDDDDE
jgi:hypothetical protein